MTMISSFVRIGRRQLHTIVSKEIIKPSSPTPSHLKTYSLSFIDQTSPDAYMPMTILYPNSELYTSSHIKMMNMKNSLSQTLVKYYPFAGRLDKTTPSFVDGNDEGVEFLEAHNDKLLSEFLTNMQHEDLDQLFPNGLVWKTWSFVNDRISPLSIQVNQFACGGIAVAVSLSHKIADGRSLCNFCNDWAIMTRSFSIEQINNEASPIDPKFISIENTNLNYQGLSIDKLRDTCVTRSFVFPGSKIKDLKRNVIALTAESKQPIINPTRMKVLNWLLYTCAIKASTKYNSGSFKPTGFILTTDIRNRMNESLPNTTIGNFYLLPDFSTKNPKDVTASTFISQLRNLKKEVGGLDNIKSVFETIPLASIQTAMEEEQRKIGNYYGSTSLCRFPVYEIDFGWGKPIKAVIAGTFFRNCFVAMDTPDGDGIEVFVSLEKEDMEIFQRDPELLSFC